MKNLLYSLSLGITTLFTSNTALSMQGIQTGTLTVHNTLSEAVQYQVSSVLNGTDSTTNMTIQTTRTAQSGTIPANSQSHISSGFNFGRGELWGAVIMLTLKRQSNPAEFLHELRQLGKYLLTLDEHGNIAISRVS